MPDEAAALLVWSIFGLTLGMVVLWPFLWGKRNPIIQRDPTLDDVYYSVLLTDYDGKRHYGTPFDIGHKNLAFEEAVKILERDSDIEKAIIIRLSVTDGTRNMWVITRG